MNWELEFARCMEKRWLVLMPEARHLVENEMKAAQDDLAEAEASYQRKGFKWSTIQTYYAMFHAARALLYTKGYREKSHHCLAVAMRFLFVHQGLLDEKLVDALDDARALREDADYRTDFSEVGARHNLNHARQWLEQVERLLQKPPRPPGRPRRAAFPLIRAEAGAPPLTDDETAAALAGMDEEEARRYADSVRR